MKKTRLLDVKIELPQTFTARLAEIASGEAGRREHFLALVDYYNAIVRNVDVLQLYKDDDTRERVRHLLLEQELVLRELKTFDEYMQYKKKVD